MSEDHEWVERIGKTAYEICNDPARHRIKLNEQHTGFILESNDATVLGCLGRLSNNISILYHQS
jgi:hypothetical protein